MIRKGVLRDVGLIELREEEPLLADPNAKGIEELLFLS
jgi:hypothetical protein